MLILKLHPVDCQFQETRRMFLGSLFSVLMFFFVHEFSAENFRELNQWKQLIPRKSFKAVYITTAISNNVHGNKFLPSINMLSKWAKVGSDQFMNLSGGTWHLYVYHISSIESPVDLFQLFLVALALAERYSKNAGVSFFYFFVGGT